MVSLASRRCGLTSKYEIYSGDVLCAVFDGELTIIDEKKAPLYFDDFKLWVETRAISDKRGYTSRNIKSVSGLSALAGAYETALKSNCACITDNYWVQREGDGLTYEDVNFDNYDGSLYRLALGLDSDPFRYKGSGRNPELTNIGNSDKAWHTDENGVRWLYKSQPLKECFHEVLTSKIAKSLGINTVEYELVSSTEDAETGKRGVVRSRDFTQGQNVNLEHAEFVLRHFGVGERETANNAKIFSLYGCEKEYLSIKYLDVITGNADRHSFNYGLLKDRESGEVVGLAPNFDNNLAFESDIPIDELAWTASQFGWSRPYLTEKKKAGIRNDIYSIEAFRHYDIDSVFQRIEEAQDRFYERCVALKGLNEYEGISNSSFDKNKTVFVRGHPFKGGWRNSHWRSAPKRR